MVVSRLHCSQGVSFIYLLINLFLVNLVHGGVTIETKHAGDGKTFPSVGKSVTVHYTGYLADNGLKFDSSKDRDQPFIFTLGICLAS
mmetsp:Transcript_26093/g.85829  ORF Transcript_26093/g.85829 Transcript_26093/m.85829 type:complete len:87 (-) Transcript_26093:413-673(-)